MKLDFIKVNIIAIAYLFCFSLQGLLAQTPMSLYYLENLPQSNFVNPAMTPRANGFFGFPLANSIYVSSQSDLSFDTFVQKDGNQWITPIDSGYDYDKLYKQIGESANLNQSQAVSPLIFGFKVKKGYFTFAYSEKVNTKLRIPADMFKIVEKGFPTGSQFDFSPIGLDMTYYREFSFGYAKEINNALTVGVHVKPLFGLAALKFDMNQLQLNTSLDEWSFDVDGDVYSSLPAEVYTNPDGTIDSIEIKDLEGDQIKKSVANFSNPGVAFDLGAVYELNDKWSFSAAVNNLGFINWKTDLNSISSNGTFAFEGINTSIEDLDSLDGAFDELLDSLKSVVNVTAGKEAFTTSLSPIATIGAKYQVNYTVSFGFISQSCFEKYNFRQNFNFSTNVNLYHFLTASLNYNVNIKGVNSLGAGLALKGGPFQFYVMADQIPTKYTKIEDGSSKYYVPTSTKNFNVMLGLNFIFGGKGFKDEPML